MSFSNVLLREAFWFQEGPGVRKWQFTTSGIKLLNVANIVKDGSINLSKTDRHLSEEEVDSKYSHFLADPGDLVIASSGISIDDDGFLRTRGAFVDKCHLPLCMNTSTIRFKSLNGVSELAYLRHWLQSFEFRSQITREVTGIAQKNFGPSHLKRLRISLPPLAEQKRIAGILDAADALRAKRREALAQLDTLLHSTFLDMFGDSLTNPNLPSATMTELVAKFIDYRGKSPEKSKGGVPLITAKIVKEKEVKEPNEFIPADSYDAWMRRGIPNPGDVVITTEAPMGEVALVPDYKAAFAQRLLVLQPDETKVKSIYLMWALTMPFVVRQIRQRSTGSTVTGIRSREFKKVTLPIPSLDLQHHFAAIVESVEQQKGRQRAHLAELDTLFASLQSRAFRGDL